MKDDKYWAPINVGAITIKNKAVSTANTDITDDVGKLFQWGRSQGLNATNNATTCSDEANLEDLGHPTREDLADMSKWDGKFINGDGDLHDNWLQINGNGLPNPKSSEYVEDSWYLQLWNANNGKDNANPVKGAHDPCPAGWRVPTSDEWKKIGASSDGNPSGATINDANSVIVPGKENGKNLVLPAAGSRSTNGQSYQQGSEGFYWQSLATSEEVLYMTLGNADNPLGWHSNSITCAFSVRCIQE